MVEIPTIKLERVRDATDLLKTTPKPDHATRLLQPPFYFEIDGQVRGVYSRLDKAETTRLHQFTRKIPLQSQRRTNGMPQMSAVLGFQPRQKMRQDWCRASALTQAHPDLYGFAAGVGRDLQKKFEELLPDAWERQAASVEENVLAEYRIPGTAFTTAYVNQNRALQYHRDTGNFKDVYSNLIVLRRGMAGGHLVLPEYGVALPQDDGAMLMFDGAGIIHGVTPLRKRQQSGYRIGLVFYATAAMQRCYPYEEEMQRIQHSRTKTEETFRS